MNRIEITPITERDFHLLSELYQQLIPNEVSLAKMKEVFDRNKDNPNHIVLTAKIEGRLVGSLLAVICEMLFGQCKSFMVVEDVIVDESLRGNGIGKTLMRHVEGLAKQHNCSYIMLITDSDRIDSQNFYKSIGYKTDEYRAFKKHLI